MSASGCVDSNETSGSNGSKKGDDKGGNISVLSEIGYMAGVAVGDRIVFTGAQYAGSAGLVDIYDTKKARWSTDKLSTPRNSMGVAAIGSKAYFVGGISPGSQQSDVVDIYDSDSGVWSSFNLTTARSGPGVVLVDSTLIVAGGFNTQNQNNVIANAGTNSLTSIEMINVLSGVETQASLSVPRTAHAAVAYGGKAYFIGGHPYFYGYVAACDASDTMDVLNPGSGTISTITMPHRRAHFSATVVGSKIVIGGGDNFSSDLDSVDVFDITSNQWSTLQGVVLGSGSSATTVGQFALIAGGYKNSRIVLRYDSSSGTLTTTDRLEYGRYNLVAASADGRAYFAGGVASPMDASRSIEVFETQTLLWSFLKD